jgi:cobyrinic acid a,c-diamide synthase
MDVDSAVMRSPCSESRASGNEEEWGGPLENAASSEDLVPIAVARDAAFCFYYPDNFELLEGFGARLLFFSPLAGESLPRESAGVYLGGGYPELFAETLSGNGNFLAALRNAASDGVPIYAECGGLMTLSRFIETDEGKRYPMAGILPMGTRMLKRRKALGYTEVVLRKSCLLGEEGVILRGHEFHYSEITELERAERLDCAYSIRKRKYEETRSEGYRVGSVLASYIHLHWGSMPGAAKAFVESCRASMRRKGSLKAVHH